MLASIYYKGQKVEKEQIENLLKTNPATHLTIRTYNENGEYPIRTKIGDFTGITIQNFNINNITITALEQTVCFENPENLSIYLGISLGHLMEDLNNLRKNIDDDDDYYDTVSPINAQIYQWVNLVSLTGLLPEAEIQETIQKLLEIDDIVEQMLLPDYMEDSRLNYIAFN